MKLAITLFILSLTVLQTSSIDCNASQFHFQGKYTLGKQDQLNRTFIAIQDKLGVLQNVTWKVNDTVSYRIFNATAKFYYRDTRQKAQIMGNDTIVIDGGFLEVDLLFNWSIISAFPQNGSGSARGLSDELIFAKSVVIKDGFYSYQLLDYHDPTFTNGFNISRIDPATTKPEDIANIAKLINVIQDVRTLTIQLQEDLEKFYSFYLRNSLHDQHMPINDHFDYVWIRRGLPNVTIPFSRRAVSIDIEKIGVTTTFDSQVKNYSKWQCSETTGLPLLPRNPDVYGGIQDFLSLSFIENVIKYAIENNILDTTLDQANWESRMFQFRAGDLYQIFPGIANKFYASQIVIGNCRATTQNLKVMQGGFDLINVTIHYDCELNIERQKFIDFALNLKIAIQGRPNTTALNFRYHGAEQEVFFYPYGGFVFQNKQLAQAMVRHSVNRLFEGTVFGSGWPQSPPRDYPHFMVEQNYTFIYDSTHVDPHRPSYKLE